MRSWLNTLGKPTYTTTNLSSSAGTPGLSSSAGTPNLPSLAGVTTTKPATEGALSTLSNPSFDPQTYDVSSGFGMEKYDELKALGITDKQIAEIAARAPIIGDRAVELFPELSSWGADQAVDLSVIPSEFDWEQYVKSNPDLIAADIDTKEEARRHYALYGYKENRPRTPASLALPTETVEPSSDSGRSLFGSVRAGVGEAIDDFSSRKDNIRNELQNQYDNLVAYDKKLAYRGRSSDLDRVFNQQADQLARAGVSSVGDLRVQDNKLVNLVTGEVVNTTNLKGTVSRDRDTGATKWGDIFSGVKGGANYGISTAADGSVILYPVYEKTKSPIAQIGLGDLESVITPILTVGGAIVGGPVGAGIGNTSGQLLASAKVDWEQVAKSAATTAIVASAPQVGATLAPGASTTTQAVVGAGATSVGTQIVLNDGKVDLGKVVLSAGTAGLAETGGLTSTDIAADAAQLADQGLSAAQISDTLAATGVNSVTSNLAGNFAAVGVPVSLAPALTSGTLNMGLTGLATIARGDSLNADALEKSFLLGASGGVSDVAIQEIVGADRIASIADDLGLTTEQAMAVATNAVNAGFNAEILETGNFFDEFAQSLVVNGTSFAVANQIADALRDSMSPKAVAAVTSASKNIVKVAGNAAWDGLDVGSSLENMAPLIIGDAIKSAVETPSAPPEKTSRETFLEIADKALEKEVEASVTQDGDGNTQKTVTGVDEEGEEYEYKIITTPDGDVSYSFETPAGEITRSLKRPDFNLLRRGDQPVLSEVKAKPATDEEIKKQLEDDLIFDGRQSGTVNDAAQQATKEGYNTFVFGDRTYTIPSQSEVRANIDKEIADQKSFSDAYKVARDKLGPNETFEWKGKPYSTATAEERPDLAPKTPGDYTQTDTGAAFHSNIGKKYTPEEMRILEMSVSDNASKLPTPTSEIDFVTAAATGQEVPVVGDKISKDVIAPFVTTLGTLTRGSAGIVDYTRGALESIDVIDSTSSLAKGMKDLADSMKETANFQIGDWALDQERQFVNKIYAASGLTDKAAALAQAIYDHPTAVLTLSGSEIMEEIPSIAAMMATGGVSAVARLLSLGAGATLNAVESGGQAYNEARELGASHEDAQKAAAGSAAIGAVLGTFAEAPLVRSLFKSPSPVTSAVKREVATEFPEEFVQTGMTDYFGTGKFDMNNALSSAVISVPIAGTTSGTIGTAVNLDRTGNAAEMVISANNPENAPEISNQISSILGSSDNIQDASRSIATNLESIGLNNGAATAIANTVAAEQVINNINQSLPEGSKFNISNLNTLIGATSEGSPVTLGEYVGSSISNLGPTMFVQPDVAIGTKTDGSILRVGDISSSITMNSSPSVQSTQSTDPTTGVTTKTEINSNTGVQTTTVNDPNTNIKTESVVNPDANTQLDISVDQNTNTVVATETNTDTNVKTDITSNVDVLVDEFIELGMSPYDAVTEAVKRIKDSSLAARDSGKRRGLLLGRDSDIEDVESDFRAIRTTGRRKFESPLEAFMRRARGEQEATPEAPETKPKERPMDYYSYGKPSEIDDVLGTTEIITPTGLPNIQFPELGEMAPAFAMRKGGLVPAFADGGPLTVMAGKVRRDYREGDAVEGPGDGQSDDIPAMLADGEFVIPADVVAALGNGSNKAGADKLYEMMHNIRRDYRKAKPKDLPKPAKSPLSYIKRRT